MEFKTIGALACVVLFCLPAVLAEGTADISISSYSPNWVHIKGGDVINVCGCGFSKYDNVICLFDNRWASTHSYILDDGNIICESPEFSLDWLKANGGAPVNMRLDIVFQGDLKNEYEFLGWVRVGPEISPYTPIEPSGSRVSGGGSFVINGEGFSDWSSSQVSIYLDNQPCSSASVLSDTQLQCNGVPAGELNQDAVVTVEFLGSWYFYLHSLETWAYGPRISGITPSCAGVNGGETMTINGVFMNDPAAVTGVAGVNNPMILVHVLGQTIQLFGTFVSETAIRFTAPDIVGITDLTATEVWSESASVEVYYQQVFSITTRTPMSYVVGAYFFGARDPVVNGDTYQTAVNSWPHFGGEDQICIAGCGFDQFDSASDLEMFISTSITGATGLDNICNDVGDKITISGSGDSSQVCCTSTDEANFCRHDEEAYWGVQVRIPGTSTDVFTFNGGKWQGPTTIGPVFQAYQGWITDLDGGSRTTLGHALRYANTAISSDNAGWNTNELCYSFSVYTNSPVVAADPTRSGFCNSNTNNRITVGSSSNSVYRDSLTINLPDHLFDTTLRVDVDFRDTDSCNDYAPAANHWGPFCGGVDYWLGPEYQSQDSDWGLSIYHGRVSGGQSLTISGIGLNAYGSTSHMKVAFCERSYITLDKREDSMTSRMGKMSKLREEKKRGGTCAFLPYLPFCGTSRFYDNEDQVDACQVFSLGGLNNINEGSVTVTSPSRNVEDILWGDTYDVFLYWGVTDDDYAADYTNKKSAIVDNLNFTLNTVVEDLVARKYCGTFRYGPIVTGSDCLVGPEGPAATAIPRNALDGGARDSDDPWTGTGTLTPFTLNGAYFDDNWSGLDRSKNPHKVIFDYGLGQDASNIGPVSFNTATLWDGNHNDDYQIAAIFDTCNQTSYVDNLIRYGPEITSISASGIPGNPGNIDGETDLWGFKPFTQYGSLYDGVFNLDPKGLDVITIHGNGFEAYCGDIYSGTCNYCDSTSYDVRAIIDGQYSPWTIIRPCPVLDKREEAEKRQEIFCDDGCYEILAAVPPRPFGTVAQVAVEFGNTDCPEKNPPTEQPPSSFLVPSLEPAREIDWTRVLIADQKIHYEPKITSVSPAHVRTSMFDGVTFTVTGYGFNRWDMSVDDDSSPFCYLDNYPLTLTATINSDTSITCVRPENAEDPYGLRGEFNTIVGFNVQFDGDGYTREVVDPNARDFKGDGWNYFDDIHDWKITSPTNIHMGPVCNIGEISDNFSDDIEIEITGSFFRDCQPCHDGTPDNCNSDIVPDDAGTANGELYCLHRFFDVEFVYYTNAAQTSTSTVLIQTVDPYNSTFSDSSMTVVLRGITDIINNDNSIPCPLEGYIQLRSKDAIVHSSSQLVVKCGGSVHRGPVIVSTTSDYPYDTNVHYGWIGDDVEVFGAYFEDINLAAPVCSWGGQQVAAVVVDGGHLTCTAPQLNSVSVDNHWDRWVDVNIVWPSNDVDETPCTQFAFKFHYGPGLEYHNYCSNPYEVEPVGDQLVAIDIFAPDCCGLDTSKMRCIFPSGYDSAPSDYSQDGTEGVLTCVIPEVSSEFVGIGGFGVGFFYSETDDPAEFYHSKGECDNDSSKKCLFYTISEEVLSICYGTVTVGHAPTHVRTSYIRNGLLTSDDHADDAQRITITGLNRGRAFDDDHIDSVECWLQRGSQELSLGEAEDIDGDAVVCTLENQLFSKKCADEPDKIFLRYNNGASPREKEAWNTPTTLTSSHPSQFTQTGNNVAYTLEHGPEITSVTVADWDPYNPERGTYKADGGAYRSYTDGGLELYIQLAYYEDWIGEDDGSFSYFDWGYETYAVTFGNVDWDTIDSIPLDGAITATTYDGVFNSYSDVTVHLDPHIDFYTFKGVSSSISESPLNPDFNLGSYHFRPYITGMSRTFGQQSGYESIAFYGHGFCKNSYDQVEGRFGDTPPLGGYGACDVTNDHVVVCQTPQSGAGPRTTQPYLLFNHNCNELACTDEYENVPSEISFTYYGVNDLTTPYEAPHYGDTDVTFNIHGLNNFDEVRCWFDNQNSQSFEGTVLSRSSSSVTCRTPNMDGARATIPFVKVYHNPEFKTSCSDSVATFLNPRDTLYSSNPIIFGEPCPLRVYRSDTNRPNVTEKEIDEDDIEIYVEGRFFNGGRSIEDGGSYECQFTQYRNDDNNIGDYGFEFITEVKKREVIEEAVFDWSTYRLFCDVPRNLTANGGGWDVRIRWDGADDFSECAAVLLVDSASILALSPLVFLAVCLFNALFA